MSQPYPRLKAELKKLRKMYEEQIKISREEFMMVHSKKVGTGISREEFMMVHSKKVGTEISWEEFMMVHSKKVGTGISWEKHHKIAHFKWSSWEEFIIVYCTEKLNI